MPGTHQDVWLALLYKAKALTAEEARTVSGSYSTTSATQYARRGPLVVMQAGRERVGSRDVPESYSSDDDTPRVTLKGSGSGRTGSAQSVSLPEGVAALDLQRAGNPCSNPYKIDNSIDTTPWRVPSSIQGRWEDESLDQSPFYPAPQTHSHPLADQNGMQPAAGNTHTQNGAEERRDILGNGTWLTYEECMEQGYNDEQWEDAGGPVTWQEGGYTGEVCPSTSQQTGTSSADYPYSQPTQLPPPPIPPQHPPAGIDGIGFVTGTGMGGPPKIPPPHQMQQMQDQKDEEPKESSFDLRERQQRTVQQIDNMFSNDPAFQELLKKHERGEELPKPAAHFKFKQHYIKPPGSGRNQGSHSGPHGMHVSHSAPTQASRNTPPRHQYGQGGRNTPPRQGGRNPHRSGHHQQSSRSNRPQPPQRQRGAQWQYAEAPPPQPPSPPHNPGYNNWDAQLQQHQGPDSYATAGAVTGYTGTTGYTYPQPAQNFPPSPPAAHNYMDYPQQGLPYQHHSAPAPNSGHPTHNRAGYSEQFGGGYGGYAAGR